MKVIAAIVLAGMVLTGCNTVKGLGKDVSRTGDKVTDVATDTQQKM